MKHKWHVHGAYYYFLNFSEFSKYSKLKIKHFKNNKVIYIKTIRQIIIKDTELKITFGENSRYFLRTSVLKDPESEYQSLI